MATPIRTVTAFVVLSIVGVSWPPVCNVTSIAAAQAIPAARQPLALLDEGTEIRLLLPQGARVRRRTGRLTAGLQESITAIGRPLALTLTLNLFPNVVLGAVFERVEDTNPGHVWIGTIDGTPLSLVTLAVVEGALAGHVSYPGGLYEIGADSDGSAVIAEIDPRLLPERAPPVIPADATVLAPEDAEPRVEATHAIVTIDVATFYLTSARKAVGSAAKIKAQIAGAIARTNTAYINSGINQRIRSVYVGEVTKYTGNGMYDDLLNLQGRNDGNMDSVHAIRTTKKADLVALITDEYFDTCGIAFLLRPPFAGKHTIGFSVTAVNCLSDLTYTHELGHNMGAHHDAYVLQAGEIGAYPYSLGYVDLKGYEPDGGARIDPASARVPFLTIMAAYAKCEDRGVNCSEVAYFSNPTKTIGDRRLGASEADNARTLNNTRTIVAAFSDSLSRR